MTESIQLAVAFACNLHDAGVVQDKVEHGLR